MKILGLKALSGPNYWSNFRSQLIVLKIDLQEFEYLPSNKIEGLVENLKQLMPSLYDHYCSEGKKGGFFSRLEDGTWIGHVIEHVALELQWLAGMKTGFGRTRSSQEAGIYHVVFSYEVKEAGEYAAQAAFTIINHLVHQKPYENLYQDINNLKNIYSQKGLGPSTLSIVKEAKRRNIPFVRLNDDSLFMLGQGKNQRLICAAMTDQTNVIAVDLASDKSRTKDILEEAFVPVPKGILVNTRDEIEQAVDKVGLPCVVKPAEGNHGRGITTNINSLPQALEAFSLARQFCQHVILEEYLKGDDYRFLLINYKLVAVAKRLPAHIIGDGQCSIQHLIDKENADPYRGENHDNYLSIIKVDDITCRILKEKGLTLNSVLAAGEVLYLKYAANLSAGGTAYDVTNEVHPDTVFLVERVARLMNLDILGIDVVANNIRQPLDSHNGRILEINACPGLRMHLLPQGGQARDVAKPLLDMLFPDNKPSRIPIIAVTGTNGKTTTVKLIAHLAKQAGFSVGMTTTEGIYINQHKIYYGDCSGPSSAKSVLRDKAVDFAVLECARGGILRAGLGFDKCNISIVTNITEDHLGQDGIETLEELARVKEVVPRSTLEDGYCILNADDDLVYAMKDEVISNIALFSLYANCERIHSHGVQGGLAIYLDKGSIFLYQGAAKVFFAKLDEFPLSFGGKATCMSQNILAAILSAVICEFNLVDIKNWLKNFLPTPENLPGRMNLFNINGSRVLLDYAHNEGAFAHLKEYFNSIKASKKIGIIAATGDRKPTDIKKIGFYAAQIFDEIVIRHDIDDRGCDNELQTRLLTEGIKQAQRLQDKNIKVISEGKKALDFVLKHAPSNSIILYFPESVPIAAQYLKEYQDGVMAHSSITS